MRTSGTGRLALYHDVTKCGKCAKRGITKANLCLFVSMMKRGKICFKKRVYNRKYERIVVKMGPS